MLKYPSLRGVTLATGILIAVLVLGAMVGSYSHQRAHIESDAISLELVNAGKIAEAISDAIRGIEPDLQLLVSGDGLTDYLESGTEADLARASRRFHFILGLRPQYDQIRYIDMTGRERIRVTQDGGIATADGLQDKSGRTYTKTALLLPRDHIYLSRIELNQEEGEIEVPHKPVVRMAMPVFDASGRRKGFVIVNYGLKSLYEQLNVFRQSSGRLRLINDRGYWLRSGGREAEFAFMMPEGEGQTLASTDPGLWRKLQGRKAAAVGYQGGLLAWKRLDAGDLIKGSPERLVSHMEFVLVALETDSESWEAQFSQLRLAYLVVAPLFVLLALATASSLLARRAANRAVREREEQLDVTLHSIGDAVIATDAATRVTRMNAEAERLTGWKSADARGRMIQEVFDIVNETTRAPAEIPVRRVLESGIVAGLANHTVLVSRDGMETPIADSAAPITDRRGKIIGVVLVFRDVAEARKAEEAVHKALAEVEDLYHNAPCGYHSLDASGIVTAMNDTELRWLGYTRDEVVGRMRFTDLTDEVGRQLFAANYARFKATGRVENLEFTLLRKNGKRLPVLISATAVYDENGNYTHSRSTAFDITRRKELQAEGDRFFSLPLDIMCVSDAQGTLLRINPAVSSILGWSVSELRDTRLDDLVHPDDGALTPHSVLQQKPGATSFHTEMRCRHKDGGYRVLSWHSLVLLGGRIYSTARDVTEAQAVVATMRQLNLELRVRSAQVEAANKELESFSYSVSHDLRAPLRHIQGYVSMLAKSLGDKLDPKPRRYLDTISAASAEMGQLIDDLLSFSRMGRSEFQESPVDLDRLVAETRDKLQAGALDREIEWDIRSLPPVMGDEAMIRVVLTNLMGNTAIP